MSTTTNIPTPEESDSLREALSVARALSMDDESIFGDDSESYFPEDGSDSEDGIHYLGVVDYFQVERYIAGEIFGQPYGKTVEIDVPIQGYSIRQPDGSFRIWLNVSSEYGWVPTSEAGFLQDIEAHS